MSSLFLVLFPRLAARLGQLGGRLAVLLFGQRLGGMTVLTWRSALRYRLVLVLVGLLLLTVWVLPNIIKHDGSALGFTQILVTYTLSAITALLGVTTLWLACGLLARDIEECQMHLLMTKPIPRWQIWLGKWLGVVSLTGTLLFMAGSVIYGILQLRAGQLSPRAQEVLRNEVLVARASAREPIPDLQSQVETTLKERLKNENVAAMDRGFVRQQILEQVKAVNQVVLPGHFRRWSIDLGKDAKARLKNSAMFLRVKFFSSEYGGSDKTYTCRWLVGPVDSANRATMENSFSPETAAEFQIPSNQVSDDAQLVIDAQNWNDVALLFPLEDGLEVLYSEGTYGPNFFRGLLIILFWLALLAAIGLACSSRMSFQVSSFVCLSILIVVFSGGTIKQVVEQGGIMGVSNESGTVTEPSPINLLSVQVFKGLGTLIGFAKEFSPIEALSTGRTIGWSQVIRAFVQVVVVMGGIFACAGMAILTRREIALPT